MELQDILESLDLSGDYESVDQFKADFKEKYIARELATEDEDLKKKVFGKLAGSTETSLKRLFKTLGADEELLKDFSLVALKENEEKYTQPIVEKYTTEIENLKKNATKSNDKKIEELQGKLAEIEKAKESLSEMLEKKEQTLEEVQSKYNSDIKNFKLNTKLSEIKGKFEYSDSADEFKKRGFEVYFNEKYKTDLDEHENLAIYDLDGNPVKNDKESGLATWEDVYKREAAKAGILKNNNGKTEPPTTQKHEPAPSDVYIASAGHSERLKAASQKYQG